MAMYKGTEQQLYLSKGIDVYIGMVRGAMYVPKERGSIISTLVRHVR